MITKRIAGQIYHTIQQALNIEQAPKSFLPRKLFLGLTLPGTQIHVKQQLSPGEHTPGSCHNPQTGLKENLGGIISIK